MLREVLAQEPRDGNTMRGERLMRLWCWDAHPARCDGNPGIQAAVDEVLLRNPGFLGDGDKGRLMSCDPDRCADVRLSDLQEVDPGESDGARRSPLNGGYSDAPQALASL